MVQFSLLFSEELSDDRDINIKTLENKLKVSLERIERRDKMIRELKQNDKLSKSEITSLQLDKVELQAKVKDLEQHLYPKGRFNVHNITNVFKTTMTVIFKPLRRVGASKLPFY